MKTIPLELEQKIDEIKSWMFDGDQKRVASIAKVSKQTVSNVLNKRIPPSKKVIEASIKVINENKLAFDIQPTMKIAI